MNLIPTLISLGLAASVSVFYLQNQSDEPNKINYRAALSDFEKSALEFAAHTPLQNRSTLMSTIHCTDLNRDFVKKLPTGSGWDLNIGGLDCDMATLSITTANEKKFKHFLAPQAPQGEAMLPRLTLPLLQLPKP